VKERRLIAVLPLLAWLFWASNLAFAARPNVVVILADDLGWGDLGCYNRESRIPTPHLDRLASEGLLFTDAHSPSAVCSPTRYGLLTGRYAWRTRMKSGVLWGYSPPLIAPTRPTVASFLHDLGYATACVGKWHLGLGWATERPVQFGDKPEPAADPALVDFKRPLTGGPHSVGFEYSFVLPASLDMEPYVFVENGRVVGSVTNRISASEHQRQGGPAFWRAGPIASGFSHESCQPVLLEKAEAFLRRQSRNRPFFLYLPLTSPHDPWVPVASMRGKSGIGDRGDFVAQVDATAGRVLGVLDEMGFTQNTIVLFASDNGAHWLPAEIARTGHRANGPWRGMKSDAFEGGHRVPMIVRWPGHVRAGGRSDALVGLIDLFATVADVVGRKLPRGAAEDGESFLPALRGRSRARHTPLVLHSGNGVFAVRDRNWKFVESSGSGGWSPGASTGPVQLYDLASDPAESIDLAGGMPRRVQSITHRLAAIRGESQPRK
jgi:arylsulfatase A-like enzyme